MAADVIGKKSPDGTVFGQSGEKIGFYGKTTITLRSVPASIGTTATTATMKAAINQIRNLLKLLGLGTV